MSCNVLMTVPIFSLRPCLLLKGVVVSVSAKRRCLTFGVEDAAECEQYMRDVAKVATGILDDKLLQKMFGMHSFRVTACHELARLGVADSFIQRQLRWTSTAFLMYLRNNVYTARRLNLSLTLRVNPQDRELQRNLHSHNR
jgi:hypothetical protein